MKIPVKLNGENVVLEVPSNRMLCSVLRERGLVSVKCGCFDNEATTFRHSQCTAVPMKRQICGACTVMLDGAPVPSCIVPVALARDSEIITLEYFSKTAEYADIMKGFKIAGIKLCGFCDAGKIFAAEYLLRTKTKDKKLPSLKTIYEGVSYLMPCCTSIKQLSDGIIHAFNSRADRVSIAGRGRASR